MASLNILSVGQLPDLPRRFSHRSVAAPLLSGAFHFERFKRFYPAKLIREDRSR